MGNILDADGDIVVDLDDDLLDIGDGLNKSDAANNILDAVDLNRPRPNIPVGSPDRAEHIVQSDIGRVHGVRIHIDLVFPDETTNRSDLRDAAG